MIEDAVAPDMGKPGVCRGLRNDRFAARTGTSGKAGFDGPIIIIVFCRTAPAILHAAGEHRIPGS